MNMMPLVTVICISHDHELFVERAIRSVLDQSYSNVQLIAIDDCSTDQSGNKIHALGQKHGFKTIRNNQNIGHTSTFNRAFEYAEGEFIIDLAADDMLDKERIRKGVEVFRDQPECAVHFTDAAYINENDEHIKNHYPRDQHGKLMAQVPQGDVYRYLVERFYICAASMMIRKKVLDKMGGYDENLSYEDFDFWVRSSRDHSYCFTDDILVYKRIHRSNYSGRQYRFASSQLRSTYDVCCKIAGLNRSAEEDDALNKRIMYECRKAILSGNLAVACDFIKLRFR